MDLNFYCTPGGLKQQSAGIGCVSIICLPFVLLGIFATYFLYHYVMEIQRASTWIEVPVQIQSLKLIEKQGSKGSVSKGLHVEYRYTINGVTYTGTRAALDNGNFKDESSTEKLYATLQQRLATSTATCFVDPANPSSSTLDRSFDFSVLLFSLVLAVIGSVIGAGIVMSGITQILYAKKRARLEKLHPNQPWRHREDWIRNRSQNSSITVMVSAWIVSIFNIALCLTLILLIPGGLKEGKYFVLLSLIFPLIALGLLAYAIRSTLVWKKWGRTVLHFEQNPIIPGTIFKGVLEFPARLDLTRTDAFKATLAWTRRVKTSGNSNSEQSRMVSRIPLDALMTLGSSSSGRSSVSCTFQVPIQDALRDGSIESLSWTLEIRADIPGADISLGFDLPIFYSELSR